MTWSAGRPRVRSQGRSHRPEAASPERERPKGRAFVLRQRPRPSAASGLNKQRTERTRSYATPTDGNLRRLAGIAAERDAELRVSQSLSRTCSRYLRICSCSDPSPLSRANIGRDQEAAGTRGHEPAYVLDVELRGPIVASRPYRDLDLVWITPNVPRHLAQPRHRGRELVGTDRVRIPAITDSPSALHRGRAIATKHDRHRPPCWLRRRVHAVERDVLTAKARRCLRPQRAHRTDALFQARAALDGRARPQLRTPRAATQSPDRGPCGHRRGCRSSTRAWPARPDYARGAITTEVPSFTVWDTAATKASVSRGSGIGLAPATAPAPDGI